MFMQREGECHSCGECCQTVNMTVVRDVTLRQHGNLEELQSYLSYRGIRVVGDDEKRNQLYYTMDVPCSELTADNRCRVHDSPEKPLICNRFPETKEDIEDIKSCGFRFSPILPGYPLKD
jgi:Fe-S-cluster containining protein